MEAKEILAWRKSPDPKGFIYFDKELMSSETVTLLFRSCRDSEGYINSEGWKFLFNRYGMDELLKMDVQSGWFSASEKGKKENLVFQSLISGYNPIDKEIGDYDPDTFIFMPENGFVKKIDWEKV